MCYVIMVITGWIHCDRLLLPCLSICAIILIAARDSDITQVAAVCGDSSFNRYIMPEKTMQPGASAVTSIAVIGGVMYVKDKPVETFSLQTGLEEFI